MCGIVGYIGNKPVYDILINGLKKLEYRGYDSSGIMIYNQKALVKKADSITGSRRNSTSSKMNNQSNDDTSRSSSIQREL